MLKKVKKTLRLAFLMQTNTALPVLAYMAETHCPDTLDLVLINPGYNEDSLSGHLRILGVRQTAALVAPHVICYTFESDLMDTLRPHETRLRKIRAIRSFKKLLRDTVRNVLLDHGLPLDASVEWIADVGLQPWTKYGVPAIKASLRLVPHEMRHHTELTSAMHRDAFAMPGSRGSARRLVRLYARWIASIGVGCQIMPPHWPYLLHVPHISYVLPIDWHPRCQVMPSVHDAHWYRSKAERLRRELAVDSRRRVILLLSQVKQDLSGWIDRISSVLLAAPMTADTLIDIKMHPTEPGYWKPLCGAVESRVGLRLCNDPRINLYPSELWLAAVDYDAAIGEGSGSVNVAKEIYGLPIYSFVEVLGGRKKAS